MFDVVILFLGQFTYLTSVVALVAGSFGLPLPEEVVLLILGYLAAAGFISFSGSIIVGIFGIVLGNNLAYLISRQGGRTFLEKWGYLIGLSVPRLELMEERWEQHSIKAVFCSRFMLGFRFLGPVVAGLTRMSWRKFFIVDILGVIIWVIIVNTVGYYFSLNLDAILVDLKYLKPLIFLAVLIILIIITVWQLYYRNNRHK
ncbi:MAG: DedA family protein [Candidatus Buchananbacteria bacterium]